MSDMPGGVTVALVHGGFADSSSWNGVVGRLQAGGVPVTAVANPLRGLSEDAAYVASALKQLPGRLLVVGHSYGGAVITNAAAQVDSAVGLVYVAGFAPDEGESLMDVEKDSKDSVLVSALKELQYPTAQGTQVEFSIDPAKFHDAFAGDVPEKEAAVMAATQRPFSSLGFSEKSGPPAWKKLPVWSIVPTGDKAAGTDALRSMAQRAKATITEADGSHVIMVSNPQLVTDVIMQALAEVGR
ncbi:alpha/beta hydrolase [Micromonospora sp. WMMD812]|uniref:alpha/beta fold hydrolase n=1 Tax=Micromonospora sp. WMMD812 TaxID=3015152 RepID=UPI00248C4A9B|nr:alpha/beta hydrolase [Micromonospora sp. WMMD812]WBB68369.1 alpha/beta hydrolase [Micromonospora sp. WMMD812]